MASRAKLMVQLALEKIERNNNNNVEIDKSKSKLSKDSTQCRIQGKNITICEQRVSEQYKNDNNTQGKNTGLVFADEFLCENQLYVGTEKKRNSDNLYCEESDTSVESDVLNQDSAIHISEEKGNTEGRNDQHSSEEHYLSDRKTDCDTSENKNKQEKRNDSDSLDSEIEDSLSIDLDDDFKDKDWILEKKKRKYAITYSSSEDDSTKNDCKRKKQVKGKVKKNRTFDKYQQDQSNSRCKESW